MLPTTVQVPDSLWLSDALCEGAKALWCYLRLVREQQFTFKDLRTAVRISQNSLLKYLRQLADAGWLSWTRVSLRIINCQVLTRRGRSIVLPSDLILDPTVPDAAKWLWGLIGRLKSAFHYTEVIDQSGYCQETIAKYLKKLSGAEWLKGSVHRVMRRAQFIMQTLNPLAIKRQEEIDGLELGMALARTQNGYSLGQYLLSRMVKCMTLPGTFVLENNQPVGLDNPKTGGRMHYDLLLPEYRLALEFHGRQHDELTELHASQEEFEEQRRRDRLKEELSKKEGITLYPIRAANLSFEYLRELLADKIPLRPNWDGIEHIYERLNRTAFSYRRAAQGYVELVRHSLGDSTLKAARHSTVPEPSAWPEQPPPGTAGLGS